MHSLYNTIKEISTNATESSKPSGVFFGVVKKDSPLEINIEQKLTIKEKQITLSRNVTDFETEVTVDWTSENKSGGSGDSAFSAHNHSIVGRKKIKIHNKLKTGEKVILIREQGGQRYVVLDRVVE